MGTVKDFATFNKLGKPECAEVTVANNEKLYLKAGAACAKVSTATKATQKSTKKGTTAGGTKKNATKDNKTGSKKNKTNGTDVSAAVATSTCAGGICIFLAGLFTLLAYMLRA